jgi:hypothetical protein
MLYLTGCEEKPRTIVPAAPIQSPKPKQAFEPFSQSAPDRSEPAATELLSKLLQSHTQGRPERLAELKSLRLELSGHMTHSSGLRHPATMTHLAVWPSDFRNSVTLAGPPAETITIARSGSDLWRHRLSVAEPSSEKLPIPSQYQKGVILDAHAFWYWLLLALGSTDAIVAKVPELPIDNTSFPGIQFWKSDFPTALIYIHPETYRISRIVYDGDEGGQRTLKRIDCTGAKIIREIAFPERIVVWANNQVMAEWQVDKLEFPATIEARLFQQP